MFKDVAQFIIIWMFILIGYSVVGFLTFQEIKGLNQWADSIIYFFKASFGDFDIEIFDYYLPSNRHTLRMIGIYFVLSYVFLQTLILLNVVIAMMADTYGIMTSYK